MKTIKNICTLSIILFLSLSITAQNRTISGTVNGINGLLENVKIKVLDSELTTITNAQGAFSMAVPNQDVYLQFVLKGMKTTVLVNENMQNVAVNLLPNDKKLYRMILKEESLPLCDIYLENYPEAKDYAEVKALREKYFFIQAYEIAAAKFSDTALQNYLKVYPKGKYTQKVKEAIEIAAWQKARHENTKQSYQEYLTRYPDGKAVKVAEKMMNDK